MFTIYGGKAAFDQWDQGQRVTNPAMQAGDKVTFTNCTGETHPMKAYTYEGAVVCDVPNDLLMKASPILVDLCGSFEFRTRLLVMPRKKPEGYVYEDNTAYPQESTGNSGGSGLPACGVPHQQLVTDANGNTVWEDRTHYEDVTLVTILEDSNLTLVDQVEHLYCCNTSVMPTDMPEDGAECVVCVNGSDYQATAKNAVAVGTQICLIGNTSFLEGTPTAEALGVELENTGESFLILLIQMDGYTLVTLNGEKPKTIRVDCKQKTVVQLDEKYIPDSVKGGGGTETVWFDLSMTDMSVASVSHTYEQVIQMIKANQFPAMVARIDTGTSEGTMLMFSAFIQYSENVAIILRYTMSGTTIMIKWNADGTFTTEMQAAG